MIGYRIGFQAGVKIRPLTPKNRQVLTDSVLISEDGKYILTEDGKYILISH